MMPAHRALSCYDVLFAIFEHFEGSEDSWYDYDPSTGNSGAWYVQEASCENRRTLARCARVCRAFFHPAVALLWRNVDDVSQLCTSLRTLPLSLREPHSSPTHTPKDLIQLAYLPGQTSRALQYAWRVRAIHGPRKSAIPPDNRHPAPSSSIKGQPLLQQLRRLRWTQQIFGSTELLHFIPSTLHSLHLIVRRPSTQQDESVTRHHPSLREVFLRELMRQVVGKAPLLRYLRITSSGEAKESWFAAIGELQSLETFDFLEPIYCESTTHPLLRPLAALPHLQHLKLRLSDGVMPHIEGGAFPSLRTLTLDAMFAPLSTVPAFLSTICSPYLESVSLLNCECATISVHAQLNELTEILRSKFSPTLRRFTLSLRGIGPVQEEPRPLVKTIAPLLDIHGLTDVRLTIAPEVAVVAASEHDLKKMTEAWPKATHLHLSYLPSPACPPLLDILSAARGCPGITELTLPGIDATSSGIDAVLAKRDGRLANHSMRTLNLSDAGWHSRIPDPERLARCLDSLFPAVDWQSPRLASEAWNETVQELVQLRIARVWNGNASF